jgi:hypothetical protein
MSDYATESIIAYLPRSYNRQFSPSPAGHCVGRDDPGAPNPIIAYPCVGPDAPIGPSPVPTRGRLPPGGRLSAKRTDEGALRNHLTGSVSPLIRPSVRTGPPSPQGEGFGDEGRRFGRTQRCAPTWLTERFAMNRGCGPMRASGPTPRFVDVCRGDPLRSPAAPGAMSVQGTTLRAAQGGVRQPSATKEPYGCPCKAAPTGKNHRSSNTVGAAALGGPNPRL